MKNILVIGAGTMGNGIAHVFAQSGYKVNLYDLNDASLEKGLTTIKKNLDRQIKKELISEGDKEEVLGRITTFVSLESAVANIDFVIEAATEHYENKAKLFNTLDELTSKEVILATNTSSISITKIAGNTNRPDKVIGMHFMNPVPVMTLIEIIKGYDTSEETLSTVMELSKNIGKTPVPANDKPGFVANKILMPMINEAILTLDEGTAGVAEIDEIMKLGMAHPMGPLQLADFIGLDVCLSILKVLHDGYGAPKYAPSPLLVNMVNAGHLGMKTQKGFYEWEGPKVNGVAPRFI